jgi:hypothetical protein
MNGLESFLGVGDWPRQKRLNLVRKSNGGGGTSLPQGTRTGKSSPASSVSFSYALAAKDAAASRRVEATIKELVGTVKNNFSHFVYY